MDLSESIQHMAKEGLGMKPGWVSFSVEVLGLWDKLARELEAKVVQLREEASKRGSVFRVLTPAAQATQRSKAMTDEHDGGSAFPRPYVVMAVAAPNEPVTFHSPPEDWPGGMTLRDYACIHLRVPQTGKDWLDEIIHKSQLVAAAVLKERAGG